jgi:hypothetical protein
VPLRETGRPLSILVSLTQPQVLHAQRFLLADVVDQSSESNLVRIE